MRGHPMSKAPVTRAMAAVLVGLVALSLSPRLASRRGHAAPPSVGLGAGPGSARPDDEDVIGSVTAVSPDGKTAEFARKGTTPLEPGMIARAVDMRDGQEVGIAWLELTEVGEASVKAMVA